jgi:hypothetical protein
MNETHTGPEAGDRRGGAGLAGSGTEPPAGPSSARKVITYGLLFLCLVIVSLIFRAKESGLNVNVGAAASGSPQVANDALIDPGWVGPACRKQLTPSFTLRAAYEAQASVVAGWEYAFSQDSVTPTVAELPAAQPVAVCYIDGPWPVPAKVQQALASQGLSPDRGVVILTQQGQREGDPMIGSHRQLALARPATTGTLVAPAAPAVTTTASP